MKTLGALLLATTLAFTGGCKKKDEVSAKGGDGKAAAPTPPAEDPKAKASKEDCTKVAQKQLDLETDPQMKSTMQSSMAMMVDACTGAMTAAQAKCAAAAADKNAFADCALK